MKQSGAKIDREAFAQDVAEGMSVNALAKKHKIAWTLAKQLRAETEPNSEAKSLDDANQVYPVNLEIPIGRTAELIRAIPVDELLEALETVDEPTQV